MKTEHTTKKGQVAIEFLAVVAFFLLISVPVFLYFYTSAPQKEYYAILSQAEVAADEFIKYGELVGTQGNGTSISRVIVLPKNVDRVNLNGSHASLHISSGGLESDIVRTGSVTFKEASFPINDGGSYMFTFTNVDGNVNVTKK